MQQRFGALFGFQYLIIIYIKLNLNRIKHYIHAG
jgi:hypothetical protein